MLYLCELKVQIQGSLIVLTLPKLFRSNSRSSPLYNL
jgi:hypothetical protein